jgi:YD repeat-containing protein
MKQFNSIMKITHTIRTLFLTTVAAFILTSCLEDEPAVVPSPASVTFSAPTLGISELAGPTDITLALAKPATKSGTVTVKIETEYAEDFTTTPAPIDGKIEIPVTAGQSQVKFTLTPVHNNLHHGNKQIGFTIEAVTDGLIIGTEKVLAVTIFEIDQPNLVNFVASQGSLIENSEEGFYLTIGFSLMTMGEGVVEVEITNAGALYGTYFTTEPAAVGGKITLAVATGIGNLPIKFIPVNNTTLNGHKEIGLTITSASGAVTKGNLLNFSLSLIDDELINKPKGYETIANGWRVKRTYEYNETGKLSKIFWEQNALSGIYTYQYDETGNLTKITESSTVETRFQRDVQGRIILSENFNAGLLKTYSIYSYDDAGNVGEVAVFNRQPSGEYVMSTLFLYLYYYNSNHLFKRLTYYPIPDTEDFDLIQEEKYEYYISQTVNPFPMVDILPEKNVQPFYPSQYILSRDGQVYSYPFSYAFNAQGFPIRRTASANEVTTYEYY